MCKHPNQSNPLAIAKQLFSHTNTISALTNTTLHSCRVAVPHVDLSCYLKEQPLIMQSVDGTQDLDLDLKSLWFSKSPPTFPPASINRLPGSRSYASSSGWSSSGVRKIHTFTGAIRHNSTLATTIIHLTWDGSSPGLTVKAQQRHIPPPRKLSRNELDSYRDE